MVTNNVSETKDETMKELLVKIGGKHVSICKMNVERTLKLFPHSGCGSGPDLWKSNSLKERKLTAGSQDG